MMISFSSLYTKFALSIFATLFLLAGCGGINDDNSTNDAPQDINAEIATPKSIVSLFESKAELSPDQLKAYYTLDGGTTWIPMAPKSGDTKTVVATLTDVKVDENLSIALRFEYTSLDGLSSLVLAESTTPKEIVIKKGSNKVVFAANDINTLCAECDPDNDKLSNVEEIKNDLNPNSIDPCLIGVSKIGFCTLG